MHYICKQDVTADGEQEVISYIGSTIVNSQNAHVLALCSFTLIISLYEFQQVHPCEAEGEKMELSQLFSPHVKRGRATHYLLLVELECISPVAESDSFLQLVSW